jgi:DNA primase
MKDKRGGKLYVDYGQNGEGGPSSRPTRSERATALSCRRRSRGTSSTKSSIQHALPIRTVLSRVDKHGDLFAGVLAGVQRLPSLGR